MKYLARALLMLAIVAVSLVAFTFAAPVQAGNGGVSVAFHCQGPDVWGSAEILSPSLALLGTPHCNSDGLRVMTSHPPAYSWYYVTLNVYQSGMTIFDSPLDTCAGSLVVGGHLRCESPFGPQTVTLQLR